MKSCNNFSKQHSNLRAIRLERRQFDYQKSKQEMKRSSVLQRGRSAKYHADQKRYTQSVSSPMSCFDESVMTCDTLGVAVETQTTNMLSALVATASATTLPEYVTHDTGCVRTTKRLVGPPQTPEEHYIATGGILPYRKRSEDEDSFEL